MKFFNKQEIIGLSIIFLILSLIFFPNVAVSRQRARDVTRKNDLWTLLKMVEAFKGTTGVFPEATENGEMIACFKINEKPVYDTKGKIINFIPCKWGQESFVGLLPHDPQESQGISYFYTFDGKAFHIYASLERSDQDEYSLEAFKLGLKCGLRICNSVRQ